MSITPPPLPGLDFRVREGPERVGSEVRWKVELGDGTRAELGMLAPELARDESVRRRYVRDVQRLREVSVEGLARVLATGGCEPSESASASPPWRLREDPEGETLERWLERRAPAPVDEALPLVAELVRVVHRVHRCGVVLRDLNPRNVILGQRVVLAGVGLARVDLLSTRTAASLVLEGSPYTAPEQIGSTVVDQRSDLYALGVILFRALTGSFPYGDSLGFLRDADQTPPSIRIARPEVLPAIDEVVSRCLAGDPERRPESARELADILEGRAIAGSRTDKRQICQSCGSRLRPGQRLCLACGRVAVQFEPARPGEDTVDLELRSVSEEAEKLGGLGALLGSLTEGSVPALNFLVGDRRMYSEKEQKNRIALPVRLYGGLGRDAATRLQKLFEDAGHNVRLVGRRTASLGRAEKIALAGIFAASTVAVMLMLILALPSYVVAAAAMAGALGLGLVWTIFHFSAKRRAQYRPPLLRLRRAPAALPASDPLVRRLAELLDETTASDLREQISELALLVQRLVDHRAANLLEQGEIDLATEPVGELVALIERQARRVSEIDRELGTLDEGTMVRDFAASEARGEPASAREATLTALDRLRGLEERRAAAFHRLLEASSLLRGAVELGLSMRDEQAQHDRDVALAMRVLAEETE